MSEVKEGFLCPICMADLGDVIQLQVHFKEKHSNEDPQLLRNIKDLFGKAKKKILNEDETNGTKKLAVPQQGRATRGGSASPKPLSVFGPRTEDLSHHPVSGVPKHLLVTPKPPPVLSHWDLFRGERKKRIDRNKSANQILVRLEKLLKDLPSDPAKRRAHEQSIVPWISEDLVTRCPTCARSFNLARRKHHCRLCGSIMCKDCSAQIPLDFARRVVNPASIARFKPEESDAAADTSINSTPGKSKSKFKLSGSHESLNKLMNIMELKGGGDEAFRTCVLCRSMLEKQEERSEEAASEDPMLVLLFKRLQEYMNEGHTLSEKYLAVHASLASGEQDHDLEEGKVLRVRLLKVGEAVDIVSKRIERLHTDPEGERLATPTEMKLQKRVRAGAINYVKGTLVSLPGLPTEGEYERLKVRRKEGAQQKVVEEREAAKRAKEKFERQQITSPNKDLGETFKALQSNVTTTIRNQSSQLIQATTSQQQQQQQQGVNYGQGFVLSSSGGANGSNFTASQDPMVQQIHNIRSYILEARRMGRHEEVVTLEENLKDLQAEYQRIQEEQTELEQNFNSFKGIFHKSSSPREEGEKEEEKSPEEIPDMDEYDSSGKNPFA